MTLAMRYAEEREIGREEGIEQGIEQGREEGREEEYNRILEKLTRKYMDENQCLPYDEARHMAEKMLR